MGSTPASQPPAAHGSGDSGGRDGKTSSSKRNILPTLLVLIFLTSVLNIAYHHFAHSGGDADISRIAEEAFRSSFITERTTGGVRPGTRGDDESSGKKSRKIIPDGHHILAGLTCDKFGGPSEDVAEEMVFWSDIESDSAYRSPFFGSPDDPSRTQYLTFEPDHGGWNNIRMAMETVLVMAHATGRTLVLPPEKKMYLLSKDSGKHKTDFSFNDFFHLDSISVEHEGIDVITMEEFLRREKGSGRLIDRKTNQTLAPPGDKIKWDGESNLGSLWSYLRSVGHVPLEWQPDECILAIPESHDPYDVERLRRDHRNILKMGKDAVAMETFIGNPTRVDEIAEVRMTEMIGGREKLCVYDAQAQNEHLIHLMVDHSDSSRMLTHFYAFVFFQDWKQDLYYKRFVRDHVRYIDEIVCTAARIVRAVRERAKASGAADGVYDSMHVRRGDFQYKKTRIPAEEVYERSKGELTEGSTLYIATDERDKSFFGPIKEHYNVLYLDDFKDQLGGINSNYYGMLDQLVASKGRVFYGTWWSTLSGYINRMRGYYSAKHRLEGYEEGILQSYYFIPDDRKLEMRQYMSVRKPIYMREFPTSWRDIDKGIEELHLAGASAASAEKK